MAVKISEKKLFLGIVLLLPGIFIFFNTAFFPAPVKISEKGLLFNLIAIVSLWLSVKVISKSIQRQ